MSLILISGCTQTPPDISPKNDTENPEPNFQKDTPLSYNPPQSRLDPEDVWEDLKENYGIAGDMKSGGAGIKWNMKTGIPQYVLGFRSKQYPGFPQEAAASFLQEYGELIKLEDNSLFLSDVYQNGDQYSVVYQQLYKGTPIYNGGDVRVLVTEDNRVRHLSVTYFPNITVAGGDPVDASTLENNLRNYLVSVDVPENQIDEIINQEPESFIYPLEEDGNTKFYSTWLYRIGYLECEPEGCVSSQARVFLDAFTGEVISAEGLPTP